MSDTDEDNGVDRSLHNFTAKSRRKKSMCKHDIVNIGNITDS